MSRFSNLAQQAFAFLEDAQFRTTKCEENLVQYESSQVCVLVYWDRGQLDASIELRPTGKRKEGSFSVCDILDMQQAEIPERPFMVGDESKLGFLLERLASAIKAHAQPALNGDRMFFRRLETFRSAKGAAYLREIELHDIRSKAEIAWKKRDFEKLVGFYSGIENELSASERKKLNYAKKHRPRT